MAGARVKGRGRRAQMPFQASGDIKVLCPIGNASQIVARSMSEQDKISRGRLQGVWGNGDHAHDIHRSQRNSHGDTFTELHRWIPGAAPASRPHLLCGKGLGTRHLGRREVLQRGKGQPQASEGWCPHCWARCAPLRYHTKEMPMRPHLHRRRHYSVMVRNVLWGQAAGWNPFDQFI